MSKDDLRPHNGRTDVAERVNRVELTMTDTDRLIQELVARKKDLTRKQLERIEEKLLFSL